MVTPVADTNTLESQNDLEVRMPRKNNYRSDDEVFLGCAFIVFLLACLTWGFIGWAIFRVVVANT